MTEEELEKRCRPLKDILDQWDETEEEEPEGNDQDGSYLHWPQADLHLNLEVIRTLLDPQRQQQKAVERLQNDQLFGQAIAVLRQRNQLRQADIEGLSARQVRRIEAGHHPRVSSLQRLAAAHGLSVPAYLDQIAETIHSLKENPS